MAFGTPTDGGAAYSASGGTSVAPAYPASIAADDVLVLIIGQKPSTANGGTVTTPTGWTLRESLTGAGGYGATLGADTGNTNLFIYTKDTVAGTETGNLTVTVGTNNVCWGLIVRIPGGGSTSVSYGTANGSRTTAPTSGTAFTTLLTNGATAPDLQSGDIAIWAMCIPTDVLNNGFTAPTISSTGTTFGTPVELEEPDSGTGNDIGGYIAYASATSGSSTAAPTVGVTATGTVTNVRGPIALIRVRDTSQTLTPDLYTNTQTFYDPTVTAGTVTLLPNLYTNTQTFYSPDVTQTGGGQTLLPSLYTNTQTFYQPTVATTYTLAPALFTNNQTFYTPTVTAGAVTLQPSLYTNTQTFYSPTVTQAGAPQTLAPDLYTNTQTFYSATVSQGGGTQTLEPNLFTNAQIFYTASLQKSNTLSCEDYVDPGYYDPLGYVNWSQINNNVFFAAQITQTTPPIVIIDGHDGGKGKRKKRWDEEQEARERRRAQIVDVYEQLVEGRPAVAKEIVAPYIQSGAKSTVAAAPQIDFDRLLGDLDRVQRLYREHQEMDDEDVLLLI